jgi:hypothetical protein
LTTKNGKFSKESEIDLTAAALSDIAGGVWFLNDLYLFLGFRFGLGGDEKWYVLCGVKVPVIGPQSYVWQPQLSLTRNF